MQSLNRRRRVSIGPIVVPGEGTLWAHGMQDFTARWAEGSVHFVATGRETAFAWSAGETGGLHPTWHLNVAGLRGKAYYAFRTEFEKVLSVPWSAGEDALRRRSCLLAVARRDPLRQLRLPPDVEAVWFGIRCAELDGESIFVQGGVRYRRKGGRLTDHPWMTRGLVTGKLLTLPPVEQPAWFCSLPEGSHEPIARLASALLARFPAFISSASS